MVLGGVTLKERMQEVAQKIKNTQGSTRLGSDNKATTHETVQTRGTQSCAMPKEWETPSGHVNILVRTEKKCPRPLGQGQSIGQSVGLAAAAHSKTPFTGIFCGLNEGVTRKLHEATDEAIREQVAQFR